MEEQTQIDVLNLLSSEPEPEPANDWTSRHKKHAIYTVEKDGVKTSIPVMEYLKKLSLELPPMADINGRRVYHFENLKRRFMSGKTKDDSMRLINEYCSEVAEIWNKTVESIKNKKQDPPD